MTVFEIMKKSETEALAVWLRKLLIYRGDGVFVWAKRDPVTKANRKFNTEHAGDIAGCIQGKYFRINITNTDVHCSKPMQRLVWLFEKGVWPEGVVDHINGDTHDNRISNLRDVPQKTNCHSRQINRNNTSGKQGVQFNRKWYKGCPIDYWVARWPDESGVQKVKHFRIVGDGEEQYKLACEYRDKMVSSLGYTKRHGLPLSANT